MTLQIGVAAFQEVGSVAVQVAGNAAWQTIQDVRRDTRIGKIFAFRKVLLEDGDGLTPDEAALPPCHNGDMRRQ